MPPSKSPSSDPHSIPLLYSNPQDDEEQQRTDPRSTSLPTSSPSQTIHTKSIFLDRRSNPPRNIHRSPRSS